ncbi:ABC transporter ATP-binding protein [Anaerofustis stercorihominis]|uniref:ABC transporter ATP-binding protein n=1 Tax=Anaerofustis stercorihominis TaxID=214853 RepID=A0A3E3DYR6_9FIRM|nr:ABC transporter ATP-binding protein [Anaerofustis stercorihominis]MCQ4794481.1 ABC transporter ATP-binding protein [Anaerofustis stercorihominis]RGD74245.1 ABC transporter ATP-binding protein [Anaerofustis stercorihominis]
MSNLIEIKNLFKEYNEILALNNVTLSIPKGKIVGLLGPNGSGKTTLIKLMNKLLVPSGGEITIDGMSPGIETKEIVSYLPDKSYLNEWMRVDELMDFFEDFYKDFNKKKAYKMLESLKINPTDKLKTMSKGTKEKVQLILVMSREARVYLLDEPIGGVDPASRDYILNTIINNYSEDSTVIISTHLISDIEKVLDEVIFLKNGQVVLNGDADEIREEKGMSIDNLFREEFRC